MRTIFRLAAALLCVLPAFAIDWPVIDREIAGSFGTRAFGRYLLGLEFAGEQAVRASEAGDLVFAYEGDEDFYGIPSGLGTFISLAHDQGIISTYAHLRKGSIASYMKKVKAGDVIGVSGDTGFSTEMNCLFSLYDLEKRQYANPLLFLPPSPDTKAPVIKSVHLRNSQGSQNLQESKKVRQGSQDLLVELYDPAGAKWTVGPLAPFAVRVLLNGSEKIAISFEVAKPIDGKMSIFPDAPIPFLSFYQSDGKIRLGSLSLTRGRINLEIVAMDFSGNERSVSYVLAVE